MKLTTKATIIFGMRLLDSFYDYAFGIMMLYYWIPEVRSGEWPLWVIIVPIFTLTATTILLKWNYQLYKAIKKKDD